MRLENIILLIIQIIFVSKVGDVAKIYDRNVTGNYQAVG